MEIVLTGSLDDEDGWVARLQPPFRFPDYKGATPFKALGDLLKDFEKETEETERSKPNPLL